MPLITAISDRMIALELGHPIAEGIPGDVIRDPQVVSSYLGGDLSVINRSGASRRRRRAGQTKTCEDRDERQGAADRRRLVDRRRKGATKR